MSVTHQTLIQTRGEQGQGETRFLSCRIKVGKSVRERALHWPAVTSAFHGLPVDRKLGSQQSRFREDMPVTC
jgi:hypothetical protein